MCSLTTCVSLLPNGRRYYEKDGELVFEPKRIAYYYCWTDGWALIDIPASIPFDAFIFAAGLNEQGTEGDLSQVQAAKLLKLLKAPRLLRIGRIAKFLRGAEMLASAGKLWLTMPLTTLPQASARARASWPKPLLRSRRLGRSPRQPRSPACSDVCVTMA